MSSRLLASAVVLAGMITAGPAAAQAPAGADKAPAAKAAATRAWTAPKTPWGHPDISGTWTSDGRSLFVYRLGEVPATVNRLELATGRKELWKKLVPPDVSGVTDISSVLITPDGNNYVYEYGRTLSDLYLVNDLK